VAVAFEDIEDSLRLLRATFVDDVEPLIDQGTGGSYAVATLVAVGHEELSRLRFGSPQGELSFAETLPDSWRPVAPSLYGALRDGLAHGYGAQTITYEGGRVMLGIATGPRPNPHRLVVTPFGEGGTDEDGCCSAHAGSSRTSDASSIGSRRNYGGTANCAMPSATVG
jgi:hypothetical protein